MGLEMDFCVLLVIWWVLQGWESERAIGNLYKKNESVGFNFKGGGNWRGEIQRKWNIRRSWYGDDESREREKSGWCSWCRDDESRERERKVD